MHNMIMTQTYFCRKLIVKLVMKKLQCTEVRFASFLSSRFITAIVVNPTERKLAKTHLCAMGWIAAAKCQLISKRLFKFSFAPKMNENIFVLL